MGNAQAQHASQKRHAHNASTDFSSTSSFSSSYMESPSSVSGSRSSALSDSSHDFESELLAGFSTLQLSPEESIQMEKQLDWEDSLFQGELRGQKVIFKMFDMQSLFRDGEDMLENLQLNISVIGTLTPHDNVVKFVGTLMSSQAVCVLIEHMPLRLIDLLPTTNEFSFQEKLQVCIDIAAAVFHLHENYVVHGAVTLNNVFLMPGQKSGSYIAKLNSLPLLREKHNDSELNKTVDVFDFGVLIYGLLFGAMPSGVDAQSCIFDARLPDAFGQQLVEIMKDCTDPDPEKRPSFCELKTLLDDLLKQTCIPLHVSPFASGSSRRHRHRNVFTIDRNQIFGRDIELHTAKEAIERAQQTSAPAGVSPQMCRCLFIGGPSGIGKTCFVRTLFRMLTESVNREQVSYFSGKYVQIDQNSGSSTPFSAIIHALTQLIQTKILDPAEKNPNHLKKWKKILSKALKKNGQVITTILPIVESIIGPQRAPPEASQAETRARFWSTFSAFYETLATPTHKVVLFLDDMQWSDESSMTMLEKVLANPHTFVIAAYRDNEVKPGHHLLQFMDKISRSNLTKSLTLTLCPPSARDLNKICARTLRCLSEDKTLPLSEFIHAKTSGNPFFFVQYFSMLEREGFIRFDQESGDWGWDVEDIRRQSPSYSSDIVSMMVAGLKQLSHRSRQLLQVASCLGSNFSFELLSSVCARIQIGDSVTVGEIQESDLAECIAHNLLQRSAPSSAPNSVMFNFSHDRVLQAATSLWSNMSEILPRIQLEIGRLIKAQTPSLAMGSGIFDLVGRFNAGSELIVEPNELLDVIKMNMLAVQNSVKSSAFATALLFVRIAHKLLFERFPLLVRTTTPAESDKARQQFVWSQQHTLALKVSLSAAQLEFMLSDISSGERHFMAIRKYARMGCTGADLLASEMAIAQAFCSKGEALLQRLKYAEGAGTFFQYFQQESTDPRLRGHFVEELRSATEASIASLYRRVKTAFEESTFKQIDEIQATWNEGEWRSPDLILLLTLMPVASVTYPANDVAFLVLRTTELFILSPGALSHKLPPSILACLSLVASSVVFKFKDFDMARNIAKKLWAHPNLSMSALTSTNLDYSVLALFSSVRNISKNMFRQHLPQCIKSGEISSAALTVGIGLFSLHVCGKTLPAMLTMIGKVRSFFETNFNTVLIALTNLRATACGLTFLLDGTAPDPQFEAAISACPSKYIKMCYNFYFSIGHYIYGDFPKALAYSTQACANKLPGGNRIQDEAGLLLMQCLSICRASVATQQARDETLHTIETAILPELTINFEKATFDENFAPHYYLTCAERSRVAQLTFDSQGPKNTQDSCQQTSIIATYQKAISAARKAGLIVLELLAQEALILFLDDCGMAAERVKQKLLAFDNYVYFGASRKVAMIRSDPVMAAAIEAREVEEKKQISSMFLSACASGDLRTVKRLCSRSTDLFRLRDIDQSTPLHKAVVNDGFEACKVTKFLLKNGTSIKAIDIHGSTPLHWAAQNSNSKAVSIMLQQKRQSSQEGKSPTPGTDSGLSSSEIKALLCNRDAFGYTPLHLALRPHDGEDDATAKAQQEAQFQTATVLIMYGADVNIKTSSGDTVLHIVCDSGPEAPRLAIVNFLLTNQPTIKLGIKDRNGNTALMRATRNGFARIVESFLTFICERPLTESPTPSSPQRISDSPPVSPFGPAAHVPLSSTPLSEHTDPKGQTLLHIAASNDCAEVLSLISRLPIGNTSTQMPLSTNVFATVRSLPLWMRMLVFERESQFQRNAIQVALHSGSKKFLALSQQLVDGFGEGIRDALCGMQDNSGESIQQLAVRVCPAFASWLVKQ